jgi:hypothetical protein
VELEDVAVELGLTSVEDDVAVAAASSVEVDGSADVAFFVGRLSGLNLPAWTGFFFGGILKIWKSSVMED